MHTSFESTFRSLLKSVLSEVLNEILPPLATRPESHAEQAAAEQTSLLMTPREAAKALAISARTLWTLTQTGDIARVRIGRLVRYEADAVRKWVKDASGGRRNST